MINRFIVTICFLVCGIIPQQAYETDVDRLYQSIGAVEKKIQSQLSNAPRDVTRVLILGTTGSGKTTLVHSLADKKIVAKKTIGSYYLEPQENLPNFVVGHSLESTTRMPNLWCDQQKKLLYCDCPGFMDSRGDEQEIINAFAIDTLFERPSSIKILLAMQASDFEGTRGMDAINDLRKLTMLLPNQEQLRQSLNLVVTKKMDDGFSSHEKLLGLLHKAQNLKQYVSEEAEAVSLTKTIDLLSFLAANPARVSSFPSPIAEGDYRLFKDQGKVIESLRVNPVINPSHSISLEQSATLFVLEMMRKHVNIGNLVCGLINTIHASYKDQPLEGLKWWESSVSQIMSGLPKAHTLDKFAKDCETTLQSVANTEPFSTVLGAMTKSQKYIDFAKKVLSHHMPNTSISLTLLPLLKNTHNDLKYLIQNKEFSIEQERKTRELEAAIKGSKLTQEEQNKRLRMIEKDKSEALQKLESMQRQLQQERSTASTQLQRQLQEQQSRYNNEIDTLRRQVQSSSNYESQISSLRRQLQEAENRAERLEALLLRNQLQRVVITPGFMGGGFYRPW